MKLSNLKGRTFGRLKVLRRDHSRNNNSKVYWLCVCEDGNKISVPTGHLLSGNTRSCGCLQRDLLGERRTTHGATAPGGKIAEFRIWAGMLDRCYRTANKAYPHYGGRGVKVCKEWQTDFAAFLRHVGPRPSAYHSIDRFPDNDGDYRPGNVRWATKKQQNRNQRRNLRVRIGGVTMTLIEAAEAAGLSYDRVRRRLKDEGRSLHQALGLSPGQNAEFIDAK